MRTHEPIAEASVRTTVAQIVGRSIGDIPSTADFSDDLGLDSLDRLELMAAVEKEHHVYLSDEALSSISNLRDLMKALNSKATRRQS